MPVFESPSRSSRPGPFGWSSFPAIRINAAMGKFLVFISRLKEVPNPSILRNLAANTDAGEAEKLRSTAQTRAQTATNAFRQISNRTRPHEFGSQYKHRPGKKQNGQSGVSHRNSQIFGSNDVIEAFDQPRAGCLRGAVHPLCWKDLNSSKLAPRPSPTHFAHSRFRTRRYPIFTAVFNVTAAPPRYSL